MPPSRPKTPRARLTAHPRPLEVPIPLSLWQRGLWIMHQLDPADVSYHTQLAVKVHGAVDAHALCEALRKVVERHESLRTSFPAGPGGEPVQQIHPPEDVPVSFHDLGSTAEEAERLALDLVREQQLRPYDLTMSPPVRCDVIRLGTDETVVAVAMHHLVSDAVSNAVLLRDLDRYYRIVTGAGDEDDEPLSVQYADVALYHQQRVAGGELDGALTYWQDRLAGHRPRFSPRLLHPRAAAWGSDTGVTVDLGADGSRRLRELASSVSATPFMVSFAAWSIVLAQLDPRSGSDVVIGVPVDGRASRAVQDLIGLFVNMVPVRVQVDDELTVAEFLSRVRDGLLEAYAHADVPMEWIVRSVAPPRDGVRIPLLAVSCQLQHTDGGAPTIGSYPVELIDPAPQPAKFQLALNAVMSETGTSLRITYPQGRFEHSAVALVGEHLRRVLTLMQEPDLRLAELPLPPITEEAGSMAPADCAEVVLYHPKPGTTDGVSRAEVCDLFAKTLGRPEVGPSEDFFDLGGHSLLALHVMRELRSRLGDDVPMNLLFQHPTPSGLSDALGADGGPGRAAGAHLEAGHDVRHDVGLWLGPLPPRPAGTATAALLTGCTGLTGAHVLACLLESTSIEPWVLVRAGDPAAAHLRVEAALREVGRWRSEWHARIQVLVGDLALPRFGLPHVEYLRAARRTDLVFHVAANTGLVEPYAAHFGPNVVGTREVLWFATTERLKSVHHVSTVSTMRAEDTETGQLPEDWHTPPALVPEDGYVRSKWVAEETVRQAGSLGVPTTVYRPSRICSASDGGTPPTSDAFWTIVIACVEIGLQPTGTGWDEFDDSLVPADHLAEAIVRIALCGSADGLAFNVVNASRTRLAEVLDVARSLGHQIGRTPGRAWREALAAAVADPQRRSPALEAAHLLTQTLLGRGPRPGQGVDTERADRVFAELGLACPPIDASMLASYLEALVAGGHLRAPGGASAAALPEGGPGDGEEPPTVLALWESAVRAWPRRAAATDAHETASFAELDRRSQLIAAGLAALGVSRGDRVGVRLSHDVSLLATVLAVVRVGAAFVPVDFRHNDQRSRGIMHQAGVTVTVAHDDFDGPGELDGSVTSPAALLEIGRGATAPPPGGGPVAYVMFTSGSSGPPKGVVVPHRALARYLDWVRTEYCGGDGLGAPLYSSLAFDLTITSLFGPLVSGGTVHLVDPHKGILRVAEMLCDGARFDFVKATPTHLRILVDELRGRSLRGHVSALVLGGEALPADLVEQWRELSPDTVVYNEYGPTEATVGCCVYRLEPSTPVPHPVPIGWPVPGVRLRVLDAHGRECVPGHLGELAIGGPSLAWGYDADARQTSARFVPDQNGWAPGDRSYLSGDLVHQEDDGSFYYHGRADHQLKVRGHRVEAGEVEAALRSLDDVGEALVRLRGRQEDAVLVAYVRTTSSEELDGRRVRAQLRGLLPGYMIPTDVVVVGEFPTTLNGKIDVAALPVPPGPAASIDGAAG